MRSTAAKLNTNWYGSPSGHVPPPDSDAAHQAVAHIAAYHALLPTQFQQERRWTPELALSVAVLEQALSDLRRGGFESHNTENSIALTAGARRDAAEARQWIEGRPGDDELVFGFANVCERLGLCAAAVRRKVL